MRRRRFFALLLGNSGWLLLPGCGSKSSSVADTSSPPDAEPAPVAASQQSAEVAAYEAQNRAMLRDAARREAQQAPRTRALAQQAAYRRQFQNRKGNGWVEFIDAHMQTFLALRAQAGHSPTHSVSCTICDGQGNLPMCVLCDSTGQCPTCKGKGLLPDRTICPTCMRKGTCFLCHGSGKMNDPFCDDGRIDANSTAPSYQMPIG